MLWQDGHHNYNGYHPISTFLPYNIQITSRHVFSILLSKPAQITKKGKLQKFTRAVQTSRTDHLDGPSGRTIWTDQLDEPASRTIVQATSLHSFNPPSKFFWIQNFGSKTILFRKKILLQKKFGSEKHFGPEKKFGLEKNFSLEKNFGP